MSNILILYKLFDFFRIVCCKTATNSANKQFLQIFIDNLENIKKLVVKAVDQQNCIESDTTTIFYITSLLKTVVSQVSQQNSFKHLNYE